MYFQQKNFLDIINLSKEEKYQNVTIFCQNGSVRANSLLLCAIFPVMKNIFSSIIDNNEHFMISIPDVETLELEILFDGIHQQSSTINMGSVLQELMRPPNKDEKWNNDSDILDKELELKDEEIMNECMKDHTYTLINIEEDDKDIGVEKSATSSSFVVIKLSTENESQPVQGGKDHQIDKVDPLGLSLEDQEDFCLLDPYDPYEDSKDAENQNMCEKPTKHVHIPWQCTVCQKICKGRKDYHNHMRMHETFKCSTCNEIIKKSNSKHILTCTNAKKPTLACPYENCDYKGYWQSDIRRHITARHLRKRKIKKEKVVKKKILKKVRNKVKVKRDLKQNYTIETPRKCLDCEFVANTLSEWICHLEQKHNSQRPQSMIYLCSKCTYQTTIPTNLNRHKTVHEKSKFYMKCLFCDFFSNDKEGFISHLASHEIIAKYMPTMEKKKRDGDIVFNCKECDYVTRRFHGIKMHMQRKHDVGDKIACEVCGILCSDLQYHMYKHNRIKCERCGKFYTEKNLENHYCKSEVNGYTLNCDICEKSFKTVAILNEHKKLIHELPEENYVCNICGKDFPTKPRLTVHSKTHVEKVQCPQCQKCLAPKYLEWHIKEQHGDPMLLDFKCEVCEKGFFTKCRLKKHMMNVHLKLRPYKCRYGCEFGYNDFSNRNAHERKKHGKAFTTRREEKNNAILALNSENRLL